jgi:aerobic carbon-monoxide dehydrogenase large subunit
MNDQIPSDLALMKFGIGQPVPRKEDPTLVRGEGRYTDDVSLEGQVYAAFLRSPYAHAVIKSIDTEAAREMPGVLALYTGADLAAAGLGPMQAIFEFKNRDGTPMAKPPHPALPTDRVRYVGQPVA